MGKSNEEKLLDLVKKVIFEGNGLTIDNLNAVKEIIQTLREEIASNQKLLMEFGRLLDYNQLKQDGKTSEELKLFYDEDNQAIKHALEIFESNIGIDHGQLFGYPANMQTDSYLVYYFRWLESQMYFMNSCGDAYHPGNYRMNNSEAEIEIIEQIKSNLNLPKDKYWGYINSGGTEGNFWGIREGLTKFKNGTVYYSDVAHYSVFKFIDMLNSDNIEKISSQNGAINVDELINKIKENYETNNSPAIVFLTCGTTALGSVDEVEKIKNKLVELNIPHYIHLDAAMYGGIPKNQTNSPTKNLIENLNKLDLDSISVSLHKYIGNHRVNGIILAQTQTNENYIDYIGQRDITVLGSRDFPAFSTLQRIKELYSRSNENEYYKNIEIFENLLTENNIHFIKGNEFGNTFVIDKPSDEICKKYQLSTFSYMGKECAHIIIFPYHNEKDIKQLVDEISNYKSKKLKYKGDLNG